MRRITVERRELPEGCEAVFVGHGDVAVMALDWSVPREHAARLLLDLLKKYEPGEAADYPPCPLHIAG